jgi:hypothetical protein
MKYHKNTIWKDLWRSGVSGMTGLKENGYPARMRDTRLYDSETGKNGQNFFD